MNGRIENQETIGATATLEAPFAAAELIPPMAADPIATPPPGPMTTRKVLGLAIPIIGENVLQTAVAAVDTLMVARLGAAALAGVGTAAELVFFIIAILSAVDIGATVLVSQAIGAGNRERANRLSKQAVVWGIMLALPVSILGVLFAPQIVSIFGTEPDVAAAATTYVEVTAAASVFLLLSFMCGAILRGAGDSRTPLYAAILANIINVVVAWLLIFGQFGLPQLGVAGSAIAAAAGRAVSAGLMLTLMVLGKRAISLKGGEGWLPDLGIARRLFALGIPAGLEQMLVSGGFTAMLAVVAKIGTDALAAQQVAFTALALGLVPGFGFAIASTALIGQSIGARDRQGASDALRISMRVGLSFLAVAAVIYFVFAGPILSVFSNEPGVQSDGVNALRAISFSLPFWAMWAIGAGAQRGSGDTRTPMIMGVLPIWITVLIAWIGVTRFNFDLVHVWLTYVVTVPPAGLANWFFARRRLSKPIEQLQAAP